MKRLYMRHGKGPLSVLHDLDLVLEPIHVALQSVMAIQGKQMVIISHGVVGFNNAGSGGSSSSSSKYQASSHQQSVSGVVPVYPVHSSKSSYSSESQHRSSSSSLNAAQTGNYISADEGIKTRSNFGASSGATLVQPIAASAYPIGQESSQSSFASNSRSSNQGVYTVPVYGSSADQASKYVAASASRQENQQRYTPSNTYVVYRQPVPVYGPFSTGSFDTSARFSNNQGAVYQAPVVYPARSSSNQYSAANDQQTYVIHGVQPVYGVSSDLSSQANRHTQAQYCLHLPLTKKRSRKGSTYVPVALNTASTASKYTSQEQQRTQSGASYVPIPVVSTAESHKQQQSSASSQYSAAQQHRSNNAAAGGWYYPAAGSAAVHQGSRYSAYDSQNAQAQQRVGGYVPITNDALGQRFGAVDLGLDRSGTELGSIMSESERLARLQAKNAYNGAVSGSSAIDMENRFSGNNDDASSDIGGGLGSGFKRTKSWSSSSKWASGQKYGDDGKIKTYSSLSTAESEQHNINGQKTGYKAATTTLEDDGKVSTYSLHTP
ncbi:hypothetical protein RP20_CCG006400 [Aedes albopictus]|nr:hypothetical protein RP20_CCG006400 [Aedes albopictus]